VAAVVPPPSAETGHVMMPWHAWTSTGVDDDAEGL